MQILQLMTTLDTYSKGQKYVKEVPDFMEMNFINFAK